LDAAAAWARQLYVLYVYAAHHGMAVGPALLEAVVDPEESVALWVADPNPRAQAFYRKHGFVADGTAQVEGGAREIRMVRSLSPTPKRQGAREGTWGRLLKRVAKYTAGVWGCERNGAWLPLQLPHGRVRSSTRLPSRKWCARVGTSRRWRNVGCRRRICSPMVSVRPT
jgi:hypothetical protein